MPLSINERGHIGLETGWLNRQTHRANIDIAILPDSMRREAGLDDSGMTPEQRKEAAAILRRRADELDPKQQ